MVDLYIITETVSVDVDDCYFEHTQPRVVAVVDKDPKAFLVDLADRMHGVKNVTADIILFELREHGGFSLLNAEEINSTDVAKAVHAKLYSNVKCIKCGRVTALKYYRANGDRCTVLACGAEMVGTREEGGQIFTTPRSEGDGT